MVMISKSAALSFFLNNIEVDAPIEWRDLSVLATFDNDSIQANITTEKFTFVREAYDIIKTYVENGLNGGVGIFEGIPFVIQAFNKDNTLVTFDGFIDLTNDYELLEEEQKALCSIIKNEGLNSLEKRVEALDFDFLISQGAIVQSDYIDVDYVVEKPIDPIAVITTNLTLFLLVKEIASQIRELTRDGGTIAGIAVAGITGTVGAAVYTVAAVIFQIAYAASILIAVLNLGQDLFDTFVSPKRTHKGAFLGTLLRKIANYLGYTLQTDITLLDNIVYLPSNNNVDSVKRSGLLNKAGSITKGIPNVNDYGHNVTDFMQLVKDLFYAKFAIQDEQLLFYAENSPFWFKSSTYQMPNILQPTRSYNTDELKANTLLSFNTDITDDFTIDNFIGTSYGVNVSPISINTQFANFVSGIDQIRFPVCLGNRKDELTPLENLLRSVGGVFDTVANVFGGNSNLSNKVKNRVGSLKVSNNNHAIPKLLYFEGGKIPRNHRDLFKAKVLWDRFHSYKSFVDNDFNGQKINYKNVRVPFGFNDYLSLIENSYFRDENGNECKAVRLEWNMSQDFASIDYYTRQVYTRNLKETFTEEA